MNDRRKLDAALCQRLQDLPPGSSTVIHNGQQYRVTRQNRAGGRAIAVQAEATDGSDWISFNAYALDDGIELRPCEMPLETVLEFLAGYSVINNSGRPDKQP